MAFENQYFRSDLIAAVVTVERFYRGSWKCCSSYFEAIKSCFPCRVNSISVLVINLQLKLQDHLKTLGVLVGGFESRVNISFNHNYENYTLVLLPKFTKITCVLFLT